MKVLDIPTDLISQSLIRNPAGYDKVIDTLVEQRDSTQNNLNNLFSEPNKKLFRQYSTAMGAIIGCGAFFMDHSYERDFQMASIFIGLGAVTGFASSLFAQATVPSVVQGTFSFRDNYHLKTSSLKLAQDIIGESKRGLEKKADSSSEELKTELTKLEDSLKEDLQKQSEELTNCIKAAAIFGAFTATSLGVVGVAATALSNNLLGSNWSYLSDITVGFPAAVGAILGPCALVGVIENLAEASVKNTKDALDLLSARCKVVKIEESQVEQTDAQA